MQSLPDRCLSIFMSGHRCGTMSAVAEGIASDRCGTDNATRCNRSRTIASNSAMPPVHDGESMIKSVVSLQHLSHVLTRTGKGKVDRGDSLIVVDFRVSML
jgi:hypothetical protein